jgi:hypothetical protein
MQATLNDEAPDLRRRDPDAPEDRSAVTTLLAVAVAASLLLAAILGLWAAEPSRGGCVSGSLGCETSAPLVPVRSR